MHASAAEALLPFLPEHPKHPLRVLDVGSGSGYLTALLAQFVGEEGKVVGVEHIKELVALSEANLRRWEEGRKMLDSGRVKFVVADGRLGYKDPEVSSSLGKETGQEDEAGWDAIHVGAGAKMVHQELVDQLRRPGR